MVKVVLTTREMKGEVKRITTLITKDKLKVIGFLD